MKVLITGGAGFIGNALIRTLITGGEYQVVNLDKLTYAANLDSLIPVKDLPEYTFDQVDICDLAAVESAFRSHRPDAVIHLAAESHVDRSIDGPGTCIQTNIIGTYNMLEASLAYFRDLDGPNRERFKFHHVSTDEVFGTLKDDDKAFTSYSPYRPRSPYSASKAASDHLVLAWYHTYGLPVVISNSSNNYGPYQFPEKLIPLMIINGLSGRSLPVYGGGQNIRDWLYVDDHAEALRAILKKGRIGEIYLVGGHSERRNIDVVRAICKHLDKTSPMSGGGGHESLITHVEDRPGHDYRYAIDTSKTQAEIGWAPRITFEDGLAQTVDWYLERTDWWEQIIQKKYDGSRLGLRKSISI